ncbi:FUSC family protein [Nonomuraea sp. NPDC005501]|uniref:FUSC family protein n=1 Tax=Nonomuraea sp. NPDC005501 TaxID=3156884 RepID=UPI0033A0FCC5
MIWLRMAAAALGVGGPVALGVATGHPALGALAAVGALAATGVSASGAATPEVPAPGSSAFGGRPAASAADALAGGAAGGAAGGRGSGAGARRAGRRSGRARGRVVGRGAGIVVAVAAAGFAGAAVAGHGWAGASALVVLAAAAALVGGVSRAMAETTTRFITFMVITTGLARQGHPLAVAAVVTVGIVWGVLLALPLGRAAGAAQADGTREGRVQAEGTRERVQAEGTRERVQAEGTREGRVQAEGTRERVQAEGVREGRAGKGGARRVAWRGMWSATSRQYAGRLAVCLGAAQVIALLWPHPTASWISVTVVIVVRRRLTGAARRAVERAAGTAVGALAVAVMPAWASAAWPLALLVAALAALRPPLKDRRPAAYAAVMTPLVLLLSGGASAGMAGHRIADTAVGCALALGFGYLPWAVRHRKDAARSGKDAARSRENAVHSQKNAVHSRKNAVHSRKNAVHSRKNAVHSRKNAVHSQKNAVHSRNDRAQSRSDDVRSARAVVE